MEYLGCSTGGWGVYQCVNCELADDPEEYDPFESLRVYARVHLGAPEQDEYIFGGGAPVRALNDAEFLEVFEHCITRRGWPVRKRVGGVDLRPT